MRPLRPRATERRPLTSTGGSVALPRHAGKDSVTSSLGLTRRIQSATKN
uniref:Uncharacterized protein n=1 Tax=Arundo donax TaxID=35708 RepID=A0A0A9A3Q2_ARUDO